MCLIVLAWKARADLPLVVAANRDEWRDRPARAAHWWPDAPEVFAGRDEKAGGTWLGVTRGGRFAAITNFRDPAERRSTAPSRGALVAEFLRAEAAPRDWLAALAPRAGEFNAFNLVVGDRDSLWYFGSREGAAREIEPGVHALSNHLLDEPWPKVVRARMAMQAALEAEDPEPVLFELLSDGEGAPDHALPDTGVGIEWERRLASPLITGADYGTRCSTVLALTRSGAIAFEERTRTPEGRVAGTVVEAFSLATALS